MDAKHWEERVIDLIARDQACTHSCVLGIPIVGNEVLLEDDEVLLPVGLGKLSLE